MEDEGQVIPKTTFNPKVVRVMKNLQALYDEDDEKIEEKASNEN